MYVRKFQGESIDETIKLIKKELGPEAIILKTETFKGIKSALKKSKVEITAAITEKNLKKKMNVDRVLTAEQRDSSYQASSDYLVDMIDGYDRFNENLNSTNFGYGQISLNKSVQKKNEQNSNVVSELVNANSLDNFLSDLPKENTNHFIKNEDLNFPERDSSNSQSFYKKEIVKKEDFEQFKTEIIEQIKNMEKIQDDYNEIIELRNKVTSLEKNLSNINLNKSVKNDDIQNVLTILNRSGVSEQFINKDLLFNFYSKNSSGDFNKENFIEYCVKCCQKVIKVEEISFDKHKPRVFLYLGGFGSGQSTLIKKIIKKHGSGEMFSLSSPENKKLNDCTDKILGINNFDYNDPAKLFAAVRKTISNGLNAHVDLKVSDKNINDLYQIISLFSTSLKTCHVSVTVSGRYSHRYNSNLLKRFAEYTNYFNLTFFDDCFDFGSVFNLFYENPKIKLSYISDGDQIPNDLKVAENNLIIEQIFNI